MEWERVRKREREGWSKEGRGGGGEIHDSGYAVNHFDYIHTTQELDTFSPTAEGKH